MPGGGEGEGGAVVGEREGEGERGGEGVGRSALKPFIRGSFPNTTSIITNTTTINQKKRKNIGTEEGYLNSLLPIRESFEGGSTVTSKGYSFVLHWVILVQKFGLASRK
jgi:hypothetical protein